MNVQGLNHICDSLKADGKNRRLFRLMPHAWYLGPGNYEHGPTPWKMFKGAQAKTHSFASHFSIHAISLPIQFAKFNNKKRGLRVYFDCRTNVTKVCDATGM